MSYTKRWAKYVCALGLGSFGPRCAALFATEDGLRYHQCHVQHNDHGVAIARGE
jgi:hypothetical protein